MSMTLLALVMFSTVSTAQLPIQDECPAPIFIGEAQYVRLEQWLWQNGMGQQIPQDTAERKSFFMRTIISNKAARMYVFGCWEEAVFYGE